MFRHFFVPTDGSVLSHQAVEKAVSFAKESGARITFFYARADADSSIYGEAALLRSINPDLFVQSLEQESHAALTGAQGVAQAAGVPSDALSAVSDEPYEVIIANAENCGCDLILMASHGRRGMKGLLLGSQTQKVLKHTKIPVLVCR